MGMCEQCNNDSKYSVGEIGLCKQCYVDYCEEHDDECKEPELTLSELNNKSNDYDPLGG